MTSLCPALGERYPLILPGMCPSSLQEPYGKEIPVALIGVAPYVLYGENRTWLGGSELDNIKTWEKAFGFKAKLIDVASYDKSDPPGMLFHVRTINTNQFHIWLTSSSCLLNRFTTRWQKLDWGKPLLCLTDMV